MSGTLHPMVAIMFLGAIAAAAFPVAAPPAALPAPGSQSGIYPVHPGQAGAVVPAGGDGGVVPPAARGVSRRILSRPTGGGRSRGCRSSRRWHPPSGKLRLQWVPCSKGRIPGAPQLRLDGRSVPSARGRRGAFFPAAPYMVGGARLEGAALGTNQTLSLLDSESCHSSCVARASL